MTGATNADIRQLLQQGRADEAERRLHVRLQQTPASHELHLLMSQVLVARGQIEQALEHTLQARGLAPQLGETHFAAACLLAHVGRYQEAIEAFRQVVKDRPDHAQAWFLLAKSLARQTGTASALQAFRMAHRLAPGETTLRQLADAEFESGFPQDALPLWEQIHQAAPHETQPTLRLGETLNRLGEQTSTAELLRSTLQNHGDHVELWTALGQTYEDLGDKQEAERSYLRAMEIEPGWAFPLGGLLSLLRGKSSDAQIELAHAFRRRTDLPDAERALLGYELGKALDAKGRYDEAMATWHEANAARRRQVGEPALHNLRATVDRAAEVFTPELFAQYASLGDPGDRFVFIVGMPRSGTTLTEQIIASHPQAHGAGELPEVPLIARNLRYQADGTRLPWQDLLLPTNDAWLREAIALYVRGATRHAPAGAERIIDKAPLNCFQLGLVSLMFPRARVIWCRRDPRDVALSIYGENFALDETLATDLAGIGHYILLQDRVMRHWQASLPNPILESSYEALATDFEPNARRIVDFTGLDWHPDCLDFHRNERGVQTPSRWQVKQPVHTRSIGRWRHYADELQPLVDVLATQPEYASMLQPSNPSA